MPEPRKVNGRLLAVYVDKKRITFGGYNDPAAWQKYSEFCKEWQNGEHPNKIAQPLSSDGHPPESTFINILPGTPGNSTLVADLVTQFLKFAQETKNPSDFSNYRKAGQALWQYKTLPTAKFDAFLLLQVQGWCVQAGYARTHCNKLVNFCIHMFKWGEVRRLVPPGKSVQLQAVEPLRNGATRETEERTEVPDAVVERTLPYLLPVYRAIILILRKTGARPSEICRMKVSDIDRQDSEIWLYKPKHHKTARNGKRRVIAFGREEQAILAPYLEGKQPNEAVFSPRDAVLEYKKVQEEARKTPVPPSQQKRAAFRKRHPKVKNNEHFDTRTVGKALKATILKANRELPPEQAIPDWTLYQLRHRYLTEATERYDENIAALLAGHSDPKMIRRVYDHSAERRILKLKRMEDEQEQDESEERTAG